MSYTDFDFPHSDYYNSDLRQLICKVEALWEEVNQIKSWETEHKQQYNELKAFMDAIMNGKFPEGFETTLHNWLIVNAPTILHDVISIIDVKVSDSGYMYITSPDAWKDVKFLFTGINIFPPEIPEYGHIVIVY